MLPSPESELLLAYESQHAASGADVLPDKNVHQA